MIINTKEVKTVLTKSNLPVSDYSVNPYVGCTHSCKYCYASFMKRFTGHTEPWGEFLDIKQWPEIKNAEKLRGTFKPMIMEYIRENKPELTPLYEEIYVKGKRDYWEQLNVELKAYAEALGLPYVRDDDSFKRPFDAPPIVVNYFYHEEVKKSAKINNTDR